MSTAINRLGSFVAAVAAFTAVAACWTAPADAGIAIVDTRSRVDATVGLEGSEEVTDARDTAFDFTSPVYPGTFDEAVAVEVNGPAGSARGTASQRTTITTEGGVLRVASVVEGTAVRQGAASASVLAYTILEFDVTDRPEAFVFRAKLDTNDEFPIVSGPLSLFLAGESGENLVYFFEPFVGAPTAILEAGLLRPDRYRLDYAVNPHDVPQDPAAPEGEFARIEVELLVGDPALIPLPPAAMSGAAGLIAAAGVSGWWRRRRRGGLHARRQDS